MLIFTLRGRVVRTFGISIPSILRIFLDTLHSYIILSRANIFLLKWLKFTVRVKFVWTLLEYNPILHFALKTFIKFFNNKISTQYIIHWTVGNIKIAGSQSYLLIKSITEGNIWRKLLKEKHKILSYTWDAMIVITYYKVGQL